MWDEGSSIVIALEWDIGSYGELFIFLLLGSSISYEAWTSMYRNRASSDPRMAQAEKDREKLTSDLRTRNKNIVQISHTSATTVDWANISPNADGVCLGGRIGQVKK
jgi:hypothetical protein